MNGEQTSHRQVERTKRSKKEKHKNEGIKGDYVCPVVDVVVAVVFVVTLNASENKCAKQNRNLTRNKTENVMKT